MAEELLVLDALVGGSLAPEPKTGWFERFSHMGNDLAFSKAGDFSDFLKGNPVGPGCPDNPIRAILGWLRFFDSGNWTVRLLGLHNSMQF